MTRLPYENHLNWVHDPMPPATRRHDDLTSPAPASSENTPPSEVLRKHPRRLGPRRRGSKQPASSANENSASRVADPATPLGSSANNNSTRPRSTANSNSPFPGLQPGTNQSPRNALEKHPQSFQSSQMTRHPRSTTNQNGDRRFRLDHPEIRGVYKPARIDPSRSCLSDPTECTAAPALSSPNS